MHHVVFVCTANSARNWRSTRERPAPAVHAVGTHSADRVHPATVAIARAHGLDLTGAVPRGYDDREVVPDLAVSVCGRAHESARDLDIQQLHWSVPEPVDGRAEEFPRTFELLSERIDRLTRAVPAA